MSTVRPVRQLPPVRPLHTARPVLLQVTIVAALVVPANMVVEPLGAVGYVGLMAALLLAVLSLASMAFGLHDPILPRHPARVAVALLVLSSCASYAVFSLGMTIPAGAVAQLSADRWLLLMLASVGLVLATAEAVRDRESADGVVGALVLGGAICAGAALVQAFGGVDPVEWLRGAMVGFVDNGGNTVFQARSGFMRVSGTTFHPIELAVVTGMILPLAVWRALYGRRSHVVVRWLPVVLLVAANAATVSRTGVIALLAVTVILIPFLPRIARHWALVAAPAGAALIFVTTPGLFATLAGSFGAGDADPSVSNRLDNYPRVAALIAERPWLGAGPGTYLPDSAIYVLDNQYLRSAVELGLIGAVAVGLYLVVPAVASLIAAQYAVEPSLRLLAAAVGAGATVAALTSATFDSLSFPVFSLVFPVFAGLAGAVWGAVRRSNAEHAGLTPPSPQASAPRTNPLPERPAQWIR